MSNPVNAEVVETREPQTFPGQWGVQYQVGDWSTAVVYPSKAEADWRYDYAVQRNIRARLIRIPAEGEEPTKREPATDQQIAEAMEFCGGFGDADIWRTCEEFHGIGASHDRP